MDLAPADTLPIEGRQLLGHGVNHLEHVRGWRGMGWSAWRR